MLKNIYSNNWIALKRQYNEILKLPAKGLSKVWRWWRGCSIRDRKKYQEKIREYKAFSKAHFPVWGCDTWPKYLRISAFFMRSRLNLSFSHLYLFNQLHRK